MATTWIYSGDMTKILDVETSMERERESRVVAHDDAGPLSPAGDTHDEADPPCPACAGRSLEADR